jgi:hypothetical protein
VERLDKSEARRRREIVRRLGGGHTATGWETIRRIADGEAIAIPITPHCETTTPGLDRVFEIAALFSESATSATGGDPSFFFEHTRYFRDEKKLMVAEWIEEMGLSWCPPDADPFPFWTSDSWYERVRGHGEILQPYLNMPLQDRVVFEHQGIQIALLKDEKMIFGWVGVDGFGSVCRLHSERPPKDQVPRTNVERIVNGLAYAWSIDLRLGQFNSRAALLDMAVSEGIGGATHFVAGNLFRQQVADARSALDAMVAAYWRNAHLRNIAGDASVEKVLTAPPDWRGAVGPGRTWVIGSQVGSRVDLLIEHLRVRSLTADFLGLTIPKILTAL